MKRKLFKILGITVLLLGVVVGAVYAFQIGNVDGVWTTIDTDGASYDYWATGPVGGSINYDSPTSTSDSSPSIQGSLGGTDWNQVRYGNVPSGNPNPPPTTFGGRSGFGFDGVNDVADPPAPYVNVVFLLGKWCHFNNPIYAADNPLEYVDLNLRVDSILCPDASPPSPDGTLNFGYRFTLDETNNTGENTRPYCGQETVGWPYDGTLNTYQCPYTIGTDPLCPWDGGINDDGCADEVTIGALSATDSFTCNYGGAETAFTIRIVGFVPLADSTASCPATPSGTASTTYISKEAQDSCACLYARITEATSTDVELNYFAAVEAGQVVELEWETASEVNNLGFNLYRQQEGAQGWVKLNSDLIETVVYPGAPFGGVYSFVDDGVEPGQTYFYWLMDVDVDGTASLNGPVEVMTTE